LTETGYRSVFEQLATFAEQTPLQFLEASIPRARREQQLSLI